MTNDIRYIAGPQNVVADMLSRISSLTTAEITRIDYHEIQPQQEIDEELAILLTTADHSLKLERIQMPDSDIHISCDISVYPGH